MNNFTKEELNSRISNRIHAHYVDNLSHYPAEICNASEMVLAWYLDNLSYDEVKKFYNAERIDLYDFCEIVPVSVIDKKDVKILINVIKKYLTDDIKYYDNDYITDKPAEFFISEYVREKILNYTSDEVPHAITCVTENIKYGKDSVEVDVLIIVERDNLKKIIVGHNGEMIKKIGIESRKDIESLLGKKVYLNLFVKTINKWRDKEKYLLEFGYKNNE